MTLKRDRRCLTWIEGDYNLRVSELQGTTRNSAIETTTSRSRSGNRCSGMCSCEYDYIFSKRLDC